MVLILHTYIKPDILFSIKDPDGKLWCSTLLDAEGKHVGGKGYWGYCENFQYCSSNKRGKLNNEVQDFRYCANPFIVSAVILRRTKWRTKLANPLQRPLWTHCRRYEMVYTKMKFRSFVIVQIFSGVRSTFAADEVMDEVG